MQFVGLIVTPEFLHRHLPNVLLLSVDLSTKVLNRTLGVGQFRILFDGTDGFLLLDPFSIRLKFSPAVNPNIRSLGAVDAFEGTFLMRVFASVGHGISVTRRTGRATLPAKRPIASSRKNETASVSLEPVNAFAPF
jgi:hypothetical protein